MRVRGVAQWFGILSLTLVTMIGAACWARGSSQHECCDDDAYVYVTNSNWSQVTISLSREGQVLWRVGTVETGRTQKMRIFDPGGASYTFVVRPLATTTTWMSPAMLVFPGDTLALIVENYLPFSRVLPHQ